MQAIAEHTPPSPWLDTKAAATYLSASPNTLRQWRSAGKGPRYHTVGDTMIRYHTDELDAFITGQEQ